MPLPVVLSFLTHTYWLEPWFLIPVLPFGFAQCLFINVRPFCVLDTALSLPCPWRQSPLHCAGMAQWVILLQEASNFFQDPPLPWVHFFGWPWHLTARCRSLNRPFSAKKVSTVASSLG
jgi:hypothetical protein